MPPAYVWDFSRGKNREKAIFSPLTGDEPSFDSARWNSKRNIRRTHNCYAYMFDIINEKFDRKPQPGYHSGYLHMSDDDLRSCDKLMERVQADNPSIIASSFDSRCPQGYRKGYAAIDSSNDPDYHFYRLDEDGTWSHKPGATKARTENFDGKIILRPDEARRESNSHSYNKSCGYFCFNPDMSNISNKPSKKKELRGGKRFISNNYRTSKKKRFLLLSRKGKKSFNKNEQSKIINRTLKRKKG